MKPLEGITVLDLSQFLSGPSASLRLADLGARVIKVEQPTGDICRELYVSHLSINGESSIFQAINRNKESLVANLKESEDRDKIMRLVQHSDVIMHNFRPGVIERLQLGYEVIRKVKPDIIYGAITGYGNKGPWAHKPGQDLLVQSLSGMTWISGNAGSGPVPMGLAVADILSGAHLAQGILACLVRRGVNGEGGLVEVSMLESVIDFQFEAFTTYFQDGGQPVQRTAKNNAHAYLGAPYGIYETANGYLALAMNNLPELGKLLGLISLLEFLEPASWFNQREEIKEHLARHLKSRANEQWLELLEPADIWCAPVLSWDSLMEEEGFKVLKMIQEVSMGDGFKYQTTRCPLRIDDNLLLSEKGAPFLGEHTNRICDEFHL